MTTIRLVILRLLESYFMHRWLYLVPIAITIVAAASVALLQEPKYSSRGVMYVQEGSFLSSLTSVRQDSFSWTTPSQQMINELYELVQTDAFIRAIIQKTDLEILMARDRETVEELFEAVRESMLLRPLGDNQVEIVVTFDEPNQTLQIANAIIDTYIQWQINADRAESVAAQEFFSELIVTYERDLETARQAFENYLINNPAPLRGERSEKEVLEIQSLEAEIGFAAERYSNALNNDENARLALTQAEQDIRQTYFIIDAPTEPRTPEVSLRDIVFNFGIFVAVGTFLSIVGIVGGVLFDRSVRFPLDITNTVGLPVLASLPEAKVWNAPQKKKAGRRVRSLFTRRSASPISGRGSEVLANTGSNKLAK